MPRQQSGGEEGSEPEGDLDEAAEVVEVLPLSLLELAVGNTVVEEGRGHTDVVGDLPLVPPFPGVVAVMASRMESSPDWVRKVG